LFPSDRSAAVEAPCTTGRVFARDRNSFIVMTASGECRALWGGDTPASVLAAIDLPVVGDFVEIDASRGEPFVRRVLPRINVFARRGAGGGPTQAIAANIDRLFVTIAVNRDFNLRRLERYLVAAHACGVPVAVALTKIDLVDDVASYRTAATAVAREAPVVALCSLDGRGFDELAPYRGEGRTLAFVGSSGAGKSTLVNALLGEQRQDTGVVREDDDRGRHTTTRREIFMLDDGTAVIDTPGMRELALAGVDVEDMDAVFDDVSSLAASCRFSDCAHDSEPGCAVRAGVDVARLESWRKLRREAAFVERKGDKASASAEKQRWKAIHAQVKRARKGL
jgi:ribosome biogenesis GTPase